ncbi:MAG: hypothetical protein GDA67_15845 [Nitrospira sp. CR1.3]|nr:hypothetical protein [Nitrospira sp. CR1.3]
MCLVATAVVTFLIFTWPKSEIDTAPLPLSTPGQILCPVGGMAVKTDLSVETAEGPVFFCCPHCIEKFKADPSKYEAATRAQGRARTSASQPL